MKRILVLVIIVVVAVCIDENEGKIIDVKDYGAKGDGKTLDTSSIQKALNACQEAEPSSEEPCTVRFPSGGTYVTGSLVINSSNTIVMIEKYAAIQASIESVDYGLVGPLPSYPVRAHHNSSPRLAAVLSATRVYNISIEGGGRIDGKGEQFNANTRNNATHSLQNPCVLEFLWCDGITIQDVRIENGAYYHIHPYASHNVLIDHVTIRGLAHNADGIDPDSCSQVTISNSHITTSDDHISLKSGLGQEGISFNTPTTQVLIFRNSFGPGSGVAIGSEMSGGVRDVSVLNNTFSQTVNVLRFKACPHYGGVVQNVSYSDNTFSDASTSIFVNMNYECTSQSPLIPNPLFSNIQIDHLSGNAVQIADIQCLPQCCLYWRFSNIFISKYLVAYQPCSNLTLPTFLNCTPSPSSCF